MVTMPEARIMAVQHFALWVLFIRATGPGVMSMLITHVIAQALVVNKDSIALEALDVTPQAVPMHVPHEMRLF